MSKDEGGRNSSLSEKPVRSAVVKKVVFDEVQCSPHEFHNPVLDVCET